MDDLFENQKEDIRIVRVSEHDVLQCSDHLFALRDKVLNSENMYPEIKSWLDNKVLKGFKTGERVGYVGYLGDKAVASAIVKRGSNAKFCHLKLDCDLQNSGLGELFFILMAMEVRSIAKKVHFTLPEGLWEEKKKFFQGFSFDSVSKCRQQYRLFEEELRSETEYGNLYSHVLNKVRQLNGIASISGFSMDNQLIMSLSAKYARQIMLGGKTVEIRRRFSRAWEGARFNIYASSPVRALMGEARISRVVELEPERAWEYFGPQIGSSKEEYDRYVFGADTVYALILDEVKSYTDPVPTQQLDQLLGESLRVPQSYSLVSKDPVWAMAISLAAILQGNQSKRKLHVDARIANDR